MCVLTLPLYIIILLFLLLLPRLPLLRLPHLQERLTLAQERLHHVEDKNWGIRAPFRNDATKNVLSAK